MPGRVRSPSRRPLLEPVAAAAIGALALAQAFGPDSLTGVGTTLNPIENPLAIPALSGTADLTMDVVPLVIVGYAALGLALLAWDRITRRQPADSDRRAWTALGLLLPVTIALGLAIGAATGQEGLRGWRASPRRECVTSPMSSSEDLTPGSARRTRRPRHGSGALTW